MTVDIKFGSYQTSHSIEQATLRRMQILRDEYQSRHNKIVRDSGTELISNSPLSFAFSFTTLVLAGAGVLATSPVMAAGAAFGLIASASLLGIKIAGLMAPVRQSEYEDIEQITSGVFGLTFSTIGQLIAGNQGFSTIGKIGGGIDNIIEMKSSLKEIFNEVGIVKNSPNLFAYYKAIYDLQGNATSVVSNSMLPSMYFNDVPMTTADIETDPAIEKIQHNKILEKQLSEIIERNNIEGEERTKQKAKEDDKIKGDDEAKKQKEKKEADEKRQEKEKAEEEKRKAETLAYWESYNKARENVHAYETNPPKTPTSYNYPPHTPSIKHEHLDSWLIAPKIEPNPYIVPEMSPSTIGPSYRSGSGGSSGGGSYGSDAGGLSSGPLG